MAHMAQAITQNKKAASQAAKLKHTVFYGTTTQLSMKDNYICQFHSFIVHQLLHRWQHP